MQDDPIAGSPNGHPPPRHRHQLKRWLLLELVSYPPAEGDDLDSLTRTLEELRPHVEAAVDDLVSDGLAVAIIAGSAHDRDDLLHGRGVGGVLQSLVARHAPGVVTRHRRRRASTSRPVPAGPSGLRPKQASAPNVL